MKKFLIWSILIVIVVSTFLIYWMFYNTYSEGNRAGLLQKFSHKGNIFKTYEGELIMSSIRSNMNVPLASEKFFFSVTDDSIASLLSEMEGNYLKLHYKEKRRTLPWRGDSPYVVDGVKLVEE
ncbi:MAG: hypothetical protein H7Y00_00985 [Fimbriimonadaceae bacterium]|nr:hypothetical protein [Chitinophagales bacterium]